IYTIDKIWAKLKQTSDPIVTSGTSSSADKPLFCGQCLDIRCESETVSRIITDKYIDFWYDLIGSDNQDFTTDCQQIIEQIFCQLFDKCVKCVDKEVFLRKTLILLETHLKDTKSDPNVDPNECERVAAIVERVLELTATDDITPLMTKTGKDRNLSLFMILKQLLTHSIQTETAFHSISCPTIALNDVKLMRIDSITSLTDDNLRVSEMSDLSGNESNDELAMEALEADEDFDEKLISNLVISGTHEIKNTSSYTLYVIEYDALFQQIIDPTISGSTSSLCSEHSYYYRQKVVVYRRFSEFMTLQKVLDRNKSLRRLLKGIKKPSSIQITAQNLLAFTGAGNTRLDASTIEFRRIYLQNFLKQLCNRKAIVDSPEFQKFMAYGSDGRTAYMANKSNTILPLNIDRVLYRGVKGALSIMKNALPVEPQIGRIDPTFGERMVADNEKVTIRSIVAEVESNNYMQLEKKLNIWTEERYSSDETLIRYFDSKREDISIGLELCEEENRSGIIGGLGPRSRGDGCEDPINESQTGDEMMRNESNESINPFPAFVDLAKQWYNS
ncbi:unnamed protein product, partial [Medioppia subpectinata]